MCFKPLDELTEADMIAYVHNFGLQWPQAPYQTAQGTLIPEANVTWLLISTAIMGNLPMLRYFLERMSAERRPSADAVQVDNGLTALIGAARYGNDACVDYLCSVTSREHIDTVTSVLGLSALGDAAKNGHASTVRLLLGHGASVHVRRRNGCTPLMEAAARGQLECVRLLLRAGSDVAAADHDGKSALDHAHEHLLSVRMSVPHSFTEEPDDNRLAAIIGQGVGKHTRTMLDSSAEAVKLELEAWSCTSGDTGSK